MSYLDRKANDRGSLLIMRRLLTTTGLVLAGLAATAAPSSAFTVAISDQQAQTFSNPNYAGLKLKAARYIAPYDVMSDPAQLARWDAWYKGAVAQKQRVTISFEHSRASSAKARVAPSVAAYEKATKAFKKAYPKVKEVNTWNEINRCQQGSRTEGQPKKLCKSSGAKLLAGYYKSNRKVFKGAKIVPLNVLDESNPAPAIKYVKAFRKAVGKTPVTYWGIHNYSDTNRFSSSRTKKIIAAMPKGAKVWLLETGGIVRLGSSFPYNEQRAAKALGCMFTIAKKFKQIERLYIYQFNGAAPGASFDAGLVDAGGNPRPGYQVVKSRKASKC